MQRHTAAIATYSKRTVLVLAIVTAGSLVFGAARAQQSNAQGQATSLADNLHQNFIIQHEIGHRFHIDPANLPAPKTSPIVTNRSLVVPYSGQVPQVPPGFTATPFATGLVNPRRLLVLPNGDVLVAEQSAGYLTLLRDDGSGHAEWIDRHVEDLNKPYGLAWQNDHVLSPTKTASGACRISLALFAPAEARCNGLIRYRPTSANRSPEPMARR